jgi:prenyltransferase beta subunit
MAAAPSPQHHAATPSPFLATDTSQQQHELEVKVAALYEELAECVGTSTSDSIEDSSSELQAAAGVSAEQQQQQQQRAELLVLLRDRHARYLAGGLGQLPAGFVSLAASRPWICYWALHGLALLEAPLPRDISAAQVSVGGMLCAGGVLWPAHRLPRHDRLTANLRLLILTHTQVVAFLSSCQHPQGGYGGGPGQMAHLAPTYAAVSALVTLGGNEALASIDRCGVRCAGTVNDV